MVSHLKDVEASGDHLVWTPEYLKDHGGSVKRGIILTGGEGVRSLSWKPLLGLHDFSFTVHAQANANAARHAA